MAHFYWSRRIAAAISSRLRPASRSLAQVGVVVSGITYASLPCRRIGHEASISCDDEKETDGRRAPGSPGQPVSYYGAYTGDRFGGGIGRRVDLDESAKRSLEGTGVSRVALVAETHGELRRWATAENWERATKLHKGAYFTRSENLVQESVLDRIRQHYCRGPDYLDHLPIVAALFRLEQQAEFDGRCKSTVVTRSPMVVFGKFDEKNEACVTDFANKRLGGGWLGYGCVQEEIMFIERFDYGALCAKGLTEMSVDPTSEPVACKYSMHEDEAWILRGGRRWAHLSWYGRTPKDAHSKMQLLSPIDDEGTDPVVVAIDAIKADFKVYNASHLTMMLVKAYTGFVAARCDQDVGGQRQIATGSWGCGAFYNNERVMYVVQAMAANLAGVDLTYHVLGDGNRLAPAFQFLEDAMLRKRTISETLLELAERCQQDSGWHSKFDPEKQATRRAGGKAQAGAQARL